MLGCLMAAARSRTGSESLSFYLLRAASWALHGSEERCLFRLFPLSMPFAGLVDQGLGPAPQSTLAGVQRWF